MGDRWALPCWYSLEDLVHTASQPGATLQWPVLPPRSQSHTAPSPHYTDLLGDRHLCTSCWRGRRGHRPGQMTGGRQRGKGPARPFLPLPPPGVTPPTPLLWPDASPPPPQLLGGHSPQSNVGSQAFTLGSLC